MFSTYSDRLITSAQIKKAEKLQAMAQKKLDTMEYRNVTIKGVKNLSHSDVEEIRDAMATLIETGQDPYANRLDPSPDIQAVYINAGVFSE